MFLEAFGLDSTGLLNVEFTDTVLASERVSVGVKESMKNDSY